MFDATEIRFRLLPRFEEITFAPIEIGHLAAISASAAQLLVGVLTVEGEPITSGPGLRCLSVERHAFVLS